MRAILRGLCLTFFFMLSGVACAQQPLKFQIAPTALIIKTAKQVLHFDVEIAQTPTQRIAGLMYRYDFPKDRAMLFKFDKQEILKMWMMNTPLPLDMLFLSKNGKIIAITTDTTPYSHNIITSGKPAAYALELNAGVVKDKGIKLGDRVFHPNICGTCGGEFK